MCMQKKRNSLGPAVKGAAMDVLSCSKSSPPPPPASTLEIKRLRVETIHAAAISQNQRTPAVLTQPGCGMQRCHMHYT